MKQPYWKEWGEKLLTWLPKWVELVRLNVKETTLLQIVKSFPRGLGVQFWKLCTCSLELNKAVRVRQRVGASVLTVRARGKQGEACVLCGSYKVFQCSRLNTKKQQDQALWSTKQKSFVIWPLTECVSRPLTWRFAFILLMLLNVDNCAYEGRIVVSRK